MRAGKTAKEAQLQLLRELCAEAGVPAQQDAPMDSKHDDFADQLLKQVFELPEEPALKESVVLSIRRGAVSIKQEENRLIRQAFGERKDKIPIS